MTQSPLWVFGYGSLMWQPGFDAEEQQIARVEGYQRRFCMWSFHYRGSRTTPGLVLALDAQARAVCEGVAFCVAPALAAQTLEYLRARELISNAYNEARVPVTLRDGRTVEAVTYVMNPDHEQYCAALALNEQAGIIAAAQGTRGSNAEYLANTAGHLCALGIEDTELSWLAAQVAGRIAQC